MRPNCLFSLHKHSYQKQGGCGAFPPAPLFCIFPFLGHEMLDVQAMQGQSTAHCNATLPGPRRTWFFHGKALIIIEETIVWGFSAAAAAKLLQSCPTLCDPIDGSPPGSSIPGILQARTLEWVAISFSNARKWKVKVKSLSRVRLLATPWTAAYQAPPSMGYSRQEYWSGVPLPSPGDFLAST